MRDSMRVATRVIARVAGDDARGAIGRQEMLEETDSATNVGCRQFRKARSE
jgi:hypothetical protein